NLLNKVIEEQKLSLTQLIDPASAKQLGRILGVDAIVSGTIGDLVNRLKVNARIIGTEKGDVLAVAQTAINKTEAVKKLMEEGVKGASTAQEETKTPTTPALKKPIQTIETEGFVFALEKCKKQPGGAVIYDIMITNKSETDLATVWIAALFYHGDSIYSGRSYSYLYDDLGNEYRASGVTSGNDSSSQRVSRTFAPQTTVKYTLRFENTAPEAKMAVTLILQTSVGVLTFRNIPLSE
ncbi:CsgG/HfaB family protein, partial [bacterium]|nr:CsgG/HfaB family protein [bacterium]